MAGDKSGQRVALVTGAGRGIGRAIALALAQQDWRVAINFRSDRSSAAETMAAIEGEKILVQADIAHHADRERLVAQLLAAWGRIDLLVNNAGIAPRQRQDLLKMSEASYDEVMGVNLKGPLFLTQLVAKVMIELLERDAIEQPRIININSISAYTSSVNRGEYCISKAGLAMMTALFADRLAEHGVHVYEIRPGIIKTDMTHAVRERYDQLFAEGLTPIRRWGRPEDVARAVVAIAGGYLPYSTGEVINVDGGFHLHRL
jgi:NAD(P)-dependent dehydrogenase (short-subunit alcohol dehydrogenase family)